MSGHRTIEDDGREIVTTYLVGVDCLVKYRADTEWHDQEVSVPCEHELPYEQVKLFGGSDFVK